MNNETIIDETNKNEYKKLYTMIINQYMKQNSFCGLLYPLGLSILLIVMLINPTILPTLITVDLALILGGTGYILIDNNKFKKNVIKTFKNINVYVPFKQLEEELTDIGVLEDTIYGKVNMNDIGLEKKEINNQSTKIPCSNILVDDNKPKKFYKSKKMSI